jgi:plasmid stabilization system protein ParE
MKLRFTPRATQDLIDIARYIRKRNPNASVRVRTAILDSLQSLVVFPEIGRVKNWRAYESLLLENIRTLSITAARLLS